MRAFVRTALLAASLVLPLTVACGGDPSPAGPADIAVEAVADDTTVLPPEDVPSPGEVTPLAETAAPADAPVAEDLPSDGGAEVAADVPADAGPADALPDIDPTIDSDGDGLSDLDERTVGTDPHVADTDQDGVRDGDEVAAATDPLDPASAPAWQPEALVERPHLFFGPDDLPALRARVASEHPGIARAFAALEARAALVPPDNPGPEYDMGASQQQGRVAEAAAFVGLVREDAALVAKAVALVAAPFPDPTGIGPDQYDLLESEALVGFCTAYDLVAGSGLVDEGALLTARRQLEARIDAFRAVLYDSTYAIFLGTTLNNHAIKVEAALALCAMALPDRPTAAWDLSQGLTGLSFLLREVQGTDEGGFAEGWNYLVYASTNALPLLAAYHRFAAGRTRPYRNVATLTSGFDARRGQVIDVPDLATDERLRAVYVRALWAAFPDGRLPNTDDANPARLPGGLLAALFDEPAFLTNWAVDAVGYASDNVEVATLALFDPAMVPARLDEPLEASFPAAGFALFRSDASPEALWLLVQGEHGPARANGVGHEHPDEGNLLLWYRGESLLLDPGYVNWAHHTLVNQATDHNLVLVDGAGAPAGALPPFGADAFLDEWDPDPDLTSVRVRTTYRGVAVTRRVMRVGGRFFVVADELDPADGAAHTYTAQWNGHGGEGTADGTWTPFATGGEWGRARARLAIHTVPLEGEATYGTRAEEHATGWGEWTTHTMLTVAAPMGERAGFLSVLVPVATGAAAPTVTVTRPADGVAVAEVAWGTGTDVAILNRSGGDVEVAVAGGTRTAASGLTIVPLDAGTTRPMCLPSLFERTERSEATPRGRGGAMEAKPD